MSVSPNLMTSPQVTACSEICRIVDDLSSGWRGGQVAGRTEIVKRFFGAAAPELKTLEAAGEACGLTKERFRQILAKYTEIARQRGVESGVIESLRANILEALPAAIHDLESRFAPQFGSALSLNGIESVLHRNTRLAFAGIRSNTHLINGGMFPSPVLLGSSQDSVPVARVAHLCREVCQHQCVESVELFISKLMADKPVEAKTITNHVMLAFRALADLRWLDRERGYFYKEQSLSKNAVLRAARKIIAVAGKGPDPRYSLKESIEPHGGANCQQMRPSGISTYLWPISIRLIEQTFWPHAQQKRVAPDSCPH